MPARFRIARRVAALFQRSTPVQRAALHIQ